MKVFWKHKSDPIWCVFPYNTYLYTFLFQKDLRGLSIKLNSLKQEEEARSQVTDVSNHRDSTRKSRREYN